MIDFDTVKNKNPSPFMITWDLGRRCNFDCSYCPVHRHDNFSKHATLAELKETCNFLFEYITLISKCRIDKNFYVSFTGGEPTVNPNFIKFAEYLKNEWKIKFDNDIQIKLDVTSNGAMSEQIANSIINNFDHVTISYHAEASDTIKQNVMERIKQLHNGNIDLKVNVMMHANQFDHCIDVCNLLKENNIKFIPRPIGEDPDSMLTTAHKYADEQTQWYSNFFNMQVTPTTRPCCGGRSFTLCNSSKSVETKVIGFRNFKDWYCSVNWYFLHIEQQTDLVYHHQTCQATFDGKRGSIGTISNYKNIINSLNSNINSKHMPIIVCPNNLCGCGLCVPKSKHKDQYLLDITNTINESVLL